MENRKTAWYAVALSVFSIGGLATVLWINGRRQPAPIDDRAPVIKGPLSIQEDELDFGRDVGARRFDAIAEEPVEAPEPVVLLDEDDVDPATGKPTWLSRMSPVELKKLSKEQLVRLTRGQAIAWASDAYGRLTAEQRKELEFLRWRNKYYPQRKPAWLARLIPEEVEQLSLEKLKRLSRQQVRKWAATAYAALPDRDKLDIVNNHWSLDNDGPPHEWPPPYGLRVGNVYLEPGAKTEYPIEAVNFTTNDDDVLALYKRALNDETDVREAAIQELGNVKKPEATAALTALLGVRRADPHARERAWALIVEALAKHADHSPIGEQTIATLQNLRRIRPHVRVATANRDSDFYRPNNPTRSRSLYLYPHNRQPGWVLVNIQQRASERAVAEHLANLNETARLLYLIETAWNSPRRNTEYDSHYRKASGALARSELLSLDPLSENQDHRTFLQQHRETERRAKIARKELLNYRSRPIPLIRRNILPVAVSDPIWSDLSNYVAETYRQTKDEDCLNVLLEMEAWEPLVEFKATQFAPILLERIKQMNVYRRNDRPRPASNDYGRISGQLARLGKLQYEPALPFLEELLADSQYWYSQPAAFALSHMGEKGTVVLVKHLESKDSSVRKSCAMSLLFGQDPNRVGPRRVEALKSYIKRHPTEMDSVFVRDVNMLRSQDATQR